MRSGGEQIAACGSGGREFLVLESGDAVGYNKVSVEHDVPLHMKSALAERALLAFPQQPVQG
jgi:hypothetical protein